MDSGNSSSVQSSSGGDEDAESVSTILGPHGGITHHHPSHLHATFPRPPTSSSFFDPFSTYIDAFTRSPPSPAANPDSLLNLDMLWAGSLRTLEQPLNCTDVGLLGSVLPPRGSPASAGVGPGRGPYTGGLTINPLPSPSSSPLSHPALAPPSDPPANAAAGPPQRSSRKRSRASRRAPTTVLTTDTSNFRAMVQEFTGIPAPPFSSSPFPPRSRFDLFHAPVASSTGTRSPGAGVPSAAPHSLLRPFAQKVPVPSFGPLAPRSSSSSSSASPAAITTTAVTAAATTSGTKAEGSNLTSAFATNSTAATSSSTNATSIANSLRHPPSLGDQHQSLLSAFNFQSSSSTRYSSLDAAVLGAARAMQEAGRAMPTAAGYALGGRLLPASEGMPSSRGGSSGGGDDLLRWVEGSGGSEGGG